MGILHSLTGENEDKKDLHLLLMINGLYSLSIALSNTFVNIYLWKQSGNYLDIGIYNLIVVIFNLLPLYLLEDWRKRWIELLFYDSALFF